MKTRTLFLTLLAFGIGFTGLIEAQRGGRRWGGKQDRPQMTEEQKAQFMARCEQMQQDGKFRGRRGGRGGLFGALELTDAQKEEFKALREQNRAEMQKFRDSGERPTQEQMEQIRQTHRQAFESILSDEQRTKLEELKANRPQWDGERGFGKGMGMRPGRRGGWRGRGAVFGALELTDDQKEQFKVLREEHRAEMQKFRDSGERPTQEEMEQIRQAHRRVFESILSDEQRAKLEELRANRPRRDGSGAAETVETESASTIAPQDETPTSVKAESWGKIKKDSAK